jgi:hypothetical protein
MFSADSRRLSLSPGPILEYVDHRFAIFYVIYVTFIVFAAPALQLAKTHYPPSCLIPYSFLLADMHIVEMHQFQSKLNKLHCSD